MNYKVTAQTPSDGTISLDKPMYMEAGIHENCKLDRVEVGVSINGNNFMAFYFSDEQGQIVSHTEWEPKGDDPLKVESKTNNLIERIKQIATKFMPVDAFIFEAKDFVDFCKKTKFLLDKYGFVNKLVRIKVIYNSKGFTSLPGYAKFQFIESMSILKELSKIRILSIDALVRPQTDWKKPDATETKPKVDDPFASSEDSPF
jgi:hypothetical protein